MLTHYSKNLKFKTLYSVTTDIGASKFITEIKGWKWKYRKTTVLWCETQYSMVDVCRHFALICYLSALNMDTTLLRPLLP